MTKILISFFNRIDGNFCTFIPYKTKEYKKIFHIKYLSI